MGVDGLVGEWGNLIIISKWNTNHDMMCVGAVRQDKLKKVEYNRNTMQTQIQN